MTRPVADPFDQVLRPGAGRRPQVDHGHAGLSSRSGIDLLKFVDSARAIAFLAARFTNSSLKCSQAMHCWFWNGHAGWVRLRYDASKESKPAQK